MAKKRKCKGGICAVKQLEQRKKMAAPNPSPNLQKLNTPVNQTQPTSALPALSQAPAIAPAAITPAVINQPGSNPLQEPSSPIKDPKTGRYKSSPYMRASFAAQPLEGAIVGALEGAEKGTSGEERSAAARAISAAIGATGSALANSATALKNWSINNKIKYYVRALNKYLKEPNQSDPTLQAKIKKAQMRMNELAPGMLAPGQEELPLEERNSIINQSVNAANRRGSEANYPGKGSPVDFGPGNNAIGQPGFAGGAGGGRDEVLQLPNFTREQIGLQNELIGRILENKADFGPIAQAEKSRFFQETAPALAEQYFGRNPNSFSGAYPEALGRAGANLGERLAALQAQFNAGKESNYLRGALQPAFGNIFLPATQQGGSGNNRANDYSFKNTLDRLAPALTAASGTYGRELGDYLSNKIANRTQPQTVQGTPISDEIRQPNFGRAPWERQQAPLSNLAPTNMYPNMTPLDQLFRQSTEARNKRLGGGQ